MKNSFVSVLVLSAVFLWLLACGESSLDPFSTYEYYESSVPGLGATTMVIRPDGSLELFRAVDTLHGELTQAEEMTLGALLKGVQRWDTAYRSGRDDETTLIESGPWGACGCVPREY